jgi:hypothetical protein
MKHLTSILNGTLLIALLFGCNKNKTECSIENLINISNSFNQNMEDSLSLEFEKGYETFVFNLIENESKKTIHRLLYRDIDYITIKELENGIEISNPQLQLIFFAKKGSKFFTVILKKDGYRKTSNPDRIVINVGAKKDVLTDLILFEKKFNEILLEGLPEVDPSYVSPPRTKDKF